MKYRIRKEGWFPPPSQVQHERHWFVLTDTHGRSEQLAVLLDAKPPGGQTVAACEAGRAQAPTLKQEPVCGAARQSRCR